jgi:AAA+ ATPase superfamily predicted ATPase
METKKIIVAFLLLSVFAVGTVACTDTVEAAAWKKIDSGTWKSSDPSSGYKKTLTYVTYVKGSNDIKIDMYKYKIKNNKKVFDGTLYISKIGNTMKVQSVSPTGKKLASPDYYTYKGTIKQFYKEIKKPLGLK